MKSLLYIANIRLPTEKAHGIQIMKTCEALAAQGVEVELLAPKRRNHLKDDAFDFYNVSKNFSLRKIWCLDFIFLPVFKRLTFWLETFTFYLSVKKYITPLQFHSGREDKFDAYYTRDLPIALWLSKKVDIFYEIHTLPERPRGKHKRAWKMAKGLLVISEGIREDLIKYGVNKDKILIAPDAVDLGQFSIEESKEQSRARLNLPKEKKIVLYAGHLYSWKGADLLAQASKELSEAEIYLVGGTKEDVENFKKKYNFANLHITGWQPHNLIPYWLNSADVLVLPNSAKEKISSRYTSPMKLFEYMASGAPIVASDLSSVREVLNENNCFFTPSDNPELLAKKIKESLTDKSKSARIAEQALTDVANYSWENRAKKILEALN